MDYELVIKNGTIVTAASTYSADIGVNGGRIAAIGQTETSSPSTTEPVTNASSCTITRAPICGFSRAKR